MPKKSDDKGLAAPSHERDILIVLVAWIVSFLCAMGTALPVWVQITPSYGAAVGLLASMICALTAGIVSFLGAWSTLLRLRRHA
jgi:hypothetical protein